VVLLKIAPPNLPKGEVLTGKYIRGKICKIKLSKITNK